MDTHELAALLARRIDEISRKFAVGRYVAGLDDGQVKAYTEVLKLLGYDQYGKRL